MLKITKSLLLLIVFAAMVMFAQSALAGCGCGVPATVAYAAPVVQTQYMPGVVYRTLYQPAPVTVYSPVVAYSGYATTTYRPVYRWNSPRLVPYTTYRPYISYAAAPVVAYSPVYSSCPTCNVCDTCSSCSTCETGTCGGTVTYSAPASTGCASCAAGATVVTPQPANNGATAPTLNAVPQNAVPQKTFEENVQKPATTPEIKPIPQTETRLNSTQSPLLPDPQDRTASRATYTTSTVGYATPVSYETLSDEGWQPARD